MPEPKQGGMSTWQKNAGGTLFDMMELLYDCASTRRRCRHHCRQYHFRCCLQLWPGEEGIHGVQQLLLPRRRHLPIPVGTGTSGVGISP
jgi:hypothetical protein